MRKLTSWRKLRRDGASGKIRPSLAADELMNQEPLLAPRFLNINEVRTRIGLSRSSIYNKLKLDGPYGDASFPRPKSVGKRSVRWLCDEVDAWIESRVATEGDSPAPQSPAPECSPPRTSQVLKSNVAKFSTFNMGGTNF